MAMGIARREGLTCAIGPTTLLTSSANLSQSNASSPMPSHPIPLRGGAQPADSHLQGPPPQLSGPRRRTPFNAAQQPRLPAAQPRRPAPPGWPLPRSPPPTPCRGPTPDLMPHHLPHVVQVGGAEEERRQEHHCQIAETLECVRVSQGTASVGCLWVVTRGTAHSGEAGAPRAVRRRGPRKRVKIVNGDGG